MKKGMRREVENNMKNGNSVTAAKISLWSAVISFVLLVVLHFLKPELEPSWRVISEYAIGNFGFLMVLSFLALSVSCFSLLWAIKSQVMGVWGKIGLFLLFVTAVGMAMAGIFVTDPLTAGADARTDAGRLHEIGAMLDVLPLAALLIAFGLAKNAAWKAKKQVLIWTAILTFVGLFTFIGATATMLPSDGKFGPEVMIGWPNRFLIVTYYIWLITVSTQVVKLNRRKA